MYEQPKLLEQLLSTVSASVASYLNAQIEAGAQALMIFDTWGGVLTPELYRRYSLAFMHSVLDQLKREHDGKKIPVILFSKGANHSLTDIAATGADGIGLDWTINIADASAIVGTDVAVQGNLDPSVLYSSPEVVREQVKKVLDAYPHETGHVFNLGHGIHPGIDPENVKALVDAVHEFSQR